MIENYVLSDLFPFALFAMRASAFDFPSPHSNFLTYLSCRASHSDLRQLGEKRSHFFHELNTPVANSVNVKKIRKRFLHLSYDDYGSGVKYLTEVKSAGS